MSITVTRGPLKKLEYSVDYDPADATPEASATWVEIPMGRILNTNLEQPRGVSQMVQMADGAESSANKLNAFAMPLSLAAEDTFLTALFTAETESSKVWFRVHPSQGKVKVVGGDVGCSVSVDEPAAVPALNDLEVTVLRGSIGGAIAGDTVRDSEEIT